MAKRKKPSDEQNQDNQENLNDDSFGLPDVEYKPLEPQEEASSPHAETTESTSSSTSTRDEERRETVSDYRSTYSSSYMEEENKSKAPVIIGVVVALVVLAASFLIYQFVWKPMKDKEAEQARLEAVRQREAAEEIRKRQEAEEAERERQRLAAEAAAANAQPKEGEIVTLSDRTRRYYVVISSAVDSDLVMDYAKRLSAKGVSTKIIPPFGKSKFSRLAIGDYDTFASAQTSADAAKSEYGGEVWVLKF